MKRLLSSATALAVLSAVLVFISPASAANYDKMVVFGDSLSDNGNVSAIVSPLVLKLLNYDPARITSGPTTTPASTFSLVTVEGLNLLLGLPTLSPVLTGGNNYAFANARTGFDGLDISTFTTPGTGLQVIAYLTAHPVASPDSLFVVWAGANDLLDAKTPAEVAEAEKEAISQLAVEIGALLSSGAKNIVWFNLPDLSLTPAAATMDAALSLQLKTSSAQFRADWDAVLQYYRQLYPAVKLTGIDVYSIFNAVVANPAAYGFTNVTTPAQGLSQVNPDRYLFWDDVHPTARGHAILALTALQALQPTPSN